MPDTIQPQQLIDALTAEGFTARNEGEDAFGPRGWTVWYPQGIDPTLRITAAPHTTAHALAELARAADTGRRASRVLASLGGQQDLPTNHARTSHGHVCCAWAIGSKPPRNIARCGGPGLCTKCSSEAAMIHARFPMADTAPDQVKSSTDEENREPAGDPGPTHRAQSSDEQAIRAAERAAIVAMVRRRAEAAGVDPAGDFGLSLKYVLQVIGSEPSGLIPNPALFEGIPKALDHLAALWLPKLREAVAQLERERDEVMDGWDIALPHLRDAALAEHHGQCGEAGQFDIRRCEEAHCTERARLLEKFGMLPKEWGAYLAAPAPAGLDLSGAAERAILRQCETADRGVLNADGTASAPVAAIAPGVALCGDTWLPAEFVDREAIRGWRNAGGTEPPHRCGVCGDASTPDGACVRRCAVCSSAYRDPAEPGTYWLCRSAIGHEGKHRGSKHEWTDAEQYTAAPAV